MFAHKKQKKTTNLPSDSRPDLQRSIIRPAQNPIPVELEARDDVVIVASHDGRMHHRLVQPVVLYEVLAHVGCLPRASGSREGSRHLLELGDADAPALLLP